MENWEKREITAELAEARNNAKEMKSSLQLTSRTCATRFSTSQVNEFKKLISSLHVYIATYGMVENAGGGCRVADVR